MSEHQTNECGKLMVDRLIRQHANDIPPWKPTANTDIGIGLQAYQRQLEDSFKQGEHHAGLVVWDKDQIVAAIQVVKMTVSMLTDRSHGWYCMYCGWLDAEEVTNDERCDKCGSILPT